MMSLAFGLFTQVSGSGPLGPLVSLSIALLKILPFTNVIPWHLHVLEFIKNTIWLDKR